MSYIGKVELKASDIRTSGVITISGGATNTVALGGTAPSIQAVILTINGVTQATDTYTIAGSTLTLASGNFADGDTVEAVTINDIGTTIVPADGTVTSDKLAGAVNTTIAANTAKVTNATHTGDVTGATALTIADNAVTLAKMAGLARGKIIVGDSSGDPSALTVGAANQVLKSDGADVAWGADVGGALVHLHTTTVDAEVTEIAINDVFTSAYTNYRIVFNNILPVASNNTIYMAFRETSVSAVVNMHSITRWFGVNSAGSLVYGDSPEHNMGGTELFYTATDDGGMNGYVEVFNPFLSGSADWTRTIVAMNGYVVNASGWTHVYGAAQATATTSTPCFKVWAGGSDPNIGDASIDGFVRVYGYKDS